MRILVVNAGSSSLKLSLVGDGEERLDALELEAPGGEADPASVEAFAHRVGPVDAAGHRVVHGGADHAGAALVDAALKARLRELAPLAPLHQAAALAAMDAVARALPGVPAVACFDTAFHAGMPVAARTYAIPAEWRERWGLRRYGFHGLSHAYAARRAAAVLGQDLNRLRIVTAHLGAGASLAAVSGGRSVDTTMGFTPMDGLVMATRSGSVDPGMVLHLIADRGLPAGDVAAGLERGGGLTGLAGTADMRLVLERAAGGDAVAHVALDVYVHRLRAGVAAMAAAMNGLEVLVFTGGVGENAAPVRAAAAAGLSFLGVGVDPAANLTVAGDADVSGRGAAVRTVVVRAGEDLEVARQTREVLRACSGR